MGARVFVNNRICEEIVLSKCLYSRNLVCLPQPRLGDAFYVSLFMRWLQSRGLMGRAVVICPKSVVWIYRLLGVETVEAHSFLLGKECGGGLKAEYKMIRDLRRLRRDFIFLRITNDLIEKLQQGIGGFRESKGYTLGNYTLATGGGLRYKLNDWFGASPVDGKNPKHFVHRLQTLGAQEFEEIDQEHLYKFFKSCFCSSLQNVGQPPVVPHIVIYPETSKENKNLTRHQVAALIDALKDLGPVVIVHSGKRKWNLGSYVREVSLSEQPNAGFLYAMGAKLVVSADSFPAHFCPYLASDVLIVFNQNRNRPSAEGWGVPLNHVAHFENGYLTRLDENYEAFPVDITGGAIGVASMVLQEISNEGKGL